MFRPLTDKSNQRRRGIILLVVLAMLTLFAIVGISFVLYAEAEAAASRIAREGEITAGPSVDPVDLLNFWMGQFLYDAKDEAHADTDYDYIPGVFSALRGHSVGRSMYGFNDQNANFVAFNGLGRLHYTTPPNTPFQFLSDLSLVNYTHFSNDVQSATVGAPLNFIRDPERYRFRSGATTAAALAAARGPYAGGVNAPYTYPDHNNMYLAAVQAMRNAANPAPGPVLIQSFHRPYIFGTLDRGNPNWTNAEGKYLILRPRPADMGPDFPYPEDGGGDVKNLADSPGVPNPAVPGTFFNNDSLWMDLGHPVVTLPDGRRMKPLFAPLIIDLDGRINVNVAGNIRGANTPGDPHRSNMGLGPWEINFRHIIPNLNPVPPLGQEYDRIVQYRYGPNGVPNAGGAAPAGTAPHGYFPVDYDGSNEQAGGAITQPFQLPAAGSTSSFPTFPPGFVAGPNAAERANHPSLYNPFVPAGDDAFYRVTAMEPLLRFSDRGSRAFDRTLYDTCPTNFEFYASRRMVTTINAQLDRPAVMPWLNPPGGAAASYTIAGGLTYPTGSAPVFPDPRGLLPGLPPNGAAIPVNSEFGSAPAGPRPGGDPNNAATAKLVDWRGDLAMALGRIDLNRTLTSYPGYPTSAPAPGLNPGTGRYTAAGIARFNQAQTDRQNLAQDIMDRFRLVTHPTPGSTADTWLAQLAVNIVDFIDEDDIITPFTPSGSATTVYGTELPRVVLNEAYAQRSPTATSPVDVWVELHNTFNTDPTLVDDTLPPPPPAANLNNGVKGAARLQMPAAGIGNPTYNVYQVVLATGIDPVTGAPTGAAPAPAYMTDFNPPAGPPPAYNTRVILPSNGAYSCPSNPGNAGFYLVGPPTSFPSDMGGAFPPPAPPIPVAAKTAGALGGYALAANANLFVILQRLACPHMPSSGTNPYVTVDYMTLSATGVGSQVQTKGGGAGASVAGLQSYGRNQPYAGDPSQLKPQAPVPVLVSQPQHTFYRHNAVEPAPGPASAATPNQTLTIPFDWLVHLDRQLVSPAELLHVSGFRPHQLTQNFMTGTGHYSSQFWLNNSVQIYRALEYLQTQSRVAGVGRGGRVPGLTNVNTIFDERIVQALLDANIPAGGGGSTGSNHFTTTDVTAMFGVLTAARTPRLVAGPFPIGPTHQMLLPSAGVPVADVPIGSMATGFTPGNQDQASNGIGSTILGIGASGGPFQTPGATQQYLRYEPLTKIYNNLTNKSNVFAMWITVGFFEVTDDTTLPVKLGAEIGRAQNKQIRHRMFAIIDRTNMSVATDVAALGARVGPPPASYPAIVTYAVGGGAGVTLPAIAPTGGPVLPNGAPALRVILGNGNGGAPVVPQPGVLGAPASNPQLVNWMIRGPDPATGLGGSILVINKGQPNEETVRVQAPIPNAANRITATFSFPHNAGEPIIVADNPGPIPIFTDGQAFARFPVGAPPTFPNPYTVTLPPTQPGFAPLTGSYEGIFWTISPGCLLVVDEGPNQEIVQVTNVNAGANTFRAVFTKPHTPGFVISNTVLGNPGPQAMFNRNNRRYAPDVLSNSQYGYGHRFPLTGDQAGVVRYFRIIE